MRRVTTTQVGTLLPVEPLDHAYTGHLFILWEGLYRRLTNPMGALLAGCAGCRISLYRVYENPVRVLHGARAVPIRPLWNLYDTHSKRFRLISHKSYNKRGMIGDCCIHSSHIFFLYVKCSHNPSDNIFTISSKHIMIYTSRSSQYPTIKIP